VCSKKTVSYLVKVASENSAARFRAATISRLRTELLTGTLAVTLGGVRVNPLHAVEQVAGLRAFHIRFRGAVAIALFAERVYGCYGPRQAVINPNLLHNRFSLPFRVPKVG
jgi:hypothetical protein